MSVLTDDRSYPCTDQLCGQVQADEPCPRHTGKAVAVLPALRFRKVGSPLPLAFSSVSLPRVYLLRKAPAYVRGTSLVGALFVLI